jgi:S1-C subfamily serine protease
MNKIPTSVVLAALIIICSVLAADIAAQEASKTEQPGKRETISDAIDVIRPAIVQIGFVLEKIPEKLRAQIGAAFYKASVGTGFFVHADGYVITAKHVTDGATVGSQKTLRETGARQARLFVGKALPAFNESELQFRGDFQLFEFDVVDEDSRHDLALLKLRENPFTKDQQQMASGKKVRFASKVATISTKRPRDGAVVAVSGYPLGEPVLVTNAGWMATVWSFNYRRVLLPGVPNWFQDVDPADVYLADLTINGGNSGGPVYLAENGAVIGVGIGSKTEIIVDQHGTPVSLGDRQMRHRSGLSTVVPAEYVVTLLTKNNLSWSEPRE